MSLHKARHSLQTCGTTTINTLPSSCESILSITSGGIRSTWDIFAIEAHGKRKEREGIQSQWQDLVEN